MKRSHSDKILDMAFTFVCKAETKGVDLDDALTIAEQQFALSEDEFDDLQSWFEPED